MPSPTMRDEEAHYEIKVKLAGLTIEPQAHGETLLAGPVLDQAALHGLLNKIHDLGLPQPGVEQS